MTWQSLKGKWPVICSGLFVLLMLALAAKRVWTGLAFLPDYRGYSVSDWLINYEGGFVRRGFMGQLLLELYNVWPYDVRKLILILPCIFSPILLFLLLKVFRRQGWSPVVLFDTCCLGNTLFMPDIRRDYVVLILCYLLFSQVSQWLATARRHNLLLALVLCMVLVLSYEPSAFIAFPLMFVSIWREKGWRKLLLMLVPVTTAFLAVIIAKGNLNIGQTIWDSWADCMRTYPDGTGSSEMGYGQLALGWTMPSAFMYHLRVGYMGYYFSWQTIPSIVFILVATYYLVVCMNVVRMPFFPLGKIDSKALSNVLLFQFLVMLPMFTVLSCDWGRNISLCVISAFFLVYFFPEASKRLLWIDGLSERLLRLIDRWLFLQSSATYLLVVFLLPLPICEAPHFQDALIARLLMLFM